VTRVPMCWREVVAQLGDNVQRKVLVPMSACEVEHERRKEQEPRYYVVPSDHPYPGRWMIMDRLTGAGAEQEAVRGVRWYKESNAWLWCDHMNKLDRMEQELTF